MYTDGDGLDALAAELGNQIAVGDEIALDLDALAAELDQGGDVVDALAAELDANGGSGAELDMLATELNLDALAAELEDSPADARRKEKELEKELDNDQNLHDIAVQLENLHEIAAPVSGCGSNVVTVTVTFTEPGPLGLKLGGDGQSANPVIKALVADSLSAARPQLYPGLVLSTVQEQDVTKMSFDQALREIKIATRPLKLTFLPPAEASPQEKGREAVVEWLANRGMGVVWKLEILGPKLAAALATDYPPVTDTQITLIRFDTAFLISCVWKMAGRLAVHVGVHARAEIAGAC
jgi:hypothetical protein